MSKNKITYTDIKNMSIDELSNFLEKVWRAGYFTATLKGKSESMPNFREELKEE